MRNLKLALAALVALGAVVGCSGGGDGDTQGVSKAATEGGNSKPLSSFPGQTGASPSGGAAPAGGGAATSNQ